MGDWYPDEPKTGGYLLRGGIIGAVLVGLTWAVFAWTGGGSDFGATNADSFGHHSTSNPAQQSTPSAAHTSPAQAKLQRCHRVYLAQRPVLHDARVAVAQWQVHIGAMNQLVVGVLTLQQASQFWAQTRVGARAHLVAFDTALRHLRRQAATCGDGATVAPNAPSTKLDRCELAVAARNDVLHAARASLSTWAMHMKHMDMLRSGMLSPSEAQALWIKSWHEGQRQVNRYRSAMRKADSYSSTC